MSIQRIKGAGIDYCGFFAPILLTVSKTRNDGARFAVNVCVGLDVPSGRSATPTPLSTITSIPLISSNNRSFEAFQMYFI